MERANMLGLIVCSFIFGLALNQMQEKGKILVEVLTILKEATKWVFSLILCYLPFGVLFMITSHVVEVHFFIGGRCNTVISVMGDCIRVTLVHQVSRNELEEMEEQGQEMTSASVSTTAWSRSDCPAEGEGGEAGGIINVISMWIPGAITVITLLLQCRLHAEALPPPECDPNYILLQDEMFCLELLRTNQSSPSPGTQECRGWWDQLNCWPHAAVGEIVSQPCPRFLHTTGRVFRNCTELGWTEPYPPHDIACEYSFNESLLLEVFTSQRYFLYVKVMYSVGYAVSLVSLTVAVTILCLFRRLHCTRNFIHIQLFLSFILRAALIFIRDSVLFSNEDHFHCGVYPVSCKLATVLSNYCIMANYSWLLAEGHYLYSLVSVSLFSQRRRLWSYIVVGWGSPMIIMIGWSFARYLHEDEGCWETRRSEWIWWILRVPVLLSIIVNLAFFLCIIRILVAKLRTQDMPGSDFHHYRKLAKSSLLLVSLFGLHYILFAFLPHKVKGRTYEIWNFIELAFASTQGFVVAVLYCFLNGEVQNEIQRKWLRWRLKQRMQVGPRRQCGSLSQSGGGPTNATLLIKTVTTPESGLVEQEAR
ncbi:secretin receptor [Toxotes jaculatrix]|uniref:secretin receptor n=1 Tax=Toxotes jaculatrix TaxID=941984 RepID=UPI001B3A8CE6|nr:secretin receptor [Toxotes jaculatrix]